ncbi:hypothetical protein D6779_10315 [Candidatus Parcubacteria bacterium]|nr:MAG: hypothetical protein D6779_10315 [Candidatus Parcubacteria bacterium]
MLYETEDTVILAFRSRIEELLRNLKHRTQFVDLWVRELNDVLEAGQQLGVRHIRALSKSELEELVDSVKPFVTLRMHEDALNIIRKKLREIGIGFV